MMISSIILSQHWHTLFLHCAGTKTDYNPGRISERCYCKDQRDSCHERKVLFFVSAHNDVPLVSSKHTLQLSSMHTRLIVDVEDPTQYVTSGHHLNCAYSRNAVCRTELAERKEGDEEPLHLELSGCQYTPPPKKQYSPRQSRGIFSFLFSCKGRLYHKNSVMCVCQCVTHNRPCSLVRTCSMCFSHPGYVLHM